MMAEVKVNLPKEPAGPFQSAEKATKRLKLLAYGGEGTGKTWLALHFPNVVLLDLEGGADHYAGREGIPEFDVMRTTNPDEALEAVKWLAYNDHKYRTLVVDPITVYWQGLQKKWSDIFLKRNKGTRANKFEFYDLQPKDWGTIKQEWGEFIRLLQSLDMNVIVTAHQKAKYSDSEFMKVAGETFDAEKSLGHDVDTVIQTHRDGDKFTSTVVKDRTGHLVTGSTIPTDYNQLEKAFTKKALGRKAQKQAVPISEKLKFACGEAVAKLGVTPENLLKQLNKDYNVTSIADLTHDQGTVLLKRLNVAIKKKEKDNGKG
jgi:hypothetical protein